jgi:D-glycero-beta-D-manno-heptose-7-phosphate kinase
MTDLSQTVQSAFKGKRIAIIGDLVADQFLSGSISRVSREAPVFILKHENTETRPGGAANAAANIASLGGFPLLVGATGDDEIGRLLIESLERAEVNPQFISKIENGTTTTKVRVLAGQNYSAKQQVIRIDYENDVSFVAELRSEFSDSLRSVASKADAIVVSDYGYGVVNDEIYGEARRLSGEYDIPLVVDSRFRLREFTGATSATPNQEEVETLLGRKFNDDDCADLCAELGYGSLLVTCGNNGMLVIEPGRKPCKIPAIGSTQPVDVTGAGDTVIAAFSLGLAGGLSVVDAASVANHAGGIVVMKKGTATASIGELIASLTGSGMTAAVSDFSA